jgi:hypothetical protein
MRTATLSLALTLFLAAPAAAEPQKIYDKTVEGWSISCYQDEGRFSHCACGTAWEPANAAARRNLKSGSMIGSLSTNGKGFGIIIGAEGWRFIEDKAYKVRVTFSDGAKWDFSMLGYTGDGLRYAGELKPALVKSFMKSEGFRLWINDKYVGGFQLNGSASAIAHMFGATSAYAPADGETFPSTSRLDETF